MSCDSQQEHLVEPHRRHVRGDRSAGQRSDRARRFCDDGGQVVKIGATDARPGRSRRAGLRRPGTGVAARTHDPRYPEVASRVPTDPAAPAPACEGVPEAAVEARAEDTTAARAG